MAVMFRIVGDGERQRFYYFGREITKAEYDRLTIEHRPPDIGGGERGASLVGWKPYPSEALGYHPKQIDEARRFYESRGVPTEIDSKGRPIMKSRDHRRKVLKLNGYHDNNGGYGDG